MISIFLCDEDKSCRKRYGKLIEEIARRRNIPVCISAFAGGEKLIFHLAEFPNLPDVIYLEALLRPINGVEIAWQLRENNCMAEIIFLSSSSELVFDAFNVAPVQYLLKDNTTPEQFEQVFMRAVQLSWNKQKEMLACESGNSCKVIKLTDISYFEIWKRIIVVHYGYGKTYEFYGRMEQLQSQLGEKGFVRVHRSYLVNLRYISSMHTQYLILKTGEKISIGVTHAKDSKENFAKYIKKFHIQLQ